MMYIFYLKGTNFRQAVYGHSFADARTRLSTPDRDWIALGTIKLEEFSCTYVQVTVPASHILERAALAS